jgi:hypothetical protein
LSWPKGIFEEERPSGGREEADGDVDRDRVSSSPSGMRTKERLLAFHRNCGVVGEGSSSRGDEGVRAPVRDDDRT